MQLRSPTYRISSAVVAPSAGHRHNRAGTHQHHQLMELAAYTSENNQPRYDRSSDYVAHLLCANTYSSSSTLLFFTRSACRCCARLRRGGGWGGQLLLRFSTKGVGGVGSAVFRPLCISCSIWKGLLFLFFLLSGLLLAVELPPAAVL